MSTGQRFVLPFQILLNALGVLPGSKLGFFASGTDNEEDTFSDQGLAVANPNPVISDANGQFGNIFLNPDVTYKVVASDSGDVELWTADPVAVVSLENENINDLTGVLGVAKGGTGVGAPNTLTGILKGNGAAPYSAITPPAGDLVGTTAMQELSNKTLDDPDIVDGIVDGLSYDSTILDFAGAKRSIGTLGISRRAVSAAQTLAETDNGTCIESTATGNVLTVPPNATVPLSSDFAVEYYNRTAGAVNILQAVGVTLRLMGGGALTGNRVLAPWSKCSIEASATLNEFTIAGAGLS